MITERTLRNWRKQALVDLRYSKNVTPTTNPEAVTTNTLYIDTLNKRIVRMTQELLDVHLLRKV